MSETATSVKNQSNPQVVFSWKALLRPYVKRNRSVLRFYISIAVLISIIILFLGDRILLVPVWTLVFLFYVLTVTPPQTVENKITQFGIEAAGGPTLRWEALSHFYFTKRFGSDVLTVVSHAPYFYHAYAVVPNEEIKKKLIIILSEHLVYQERPKKNVTDRMADWLTKLVAEEEPHERVKPEIATAPKTQEPSL